MYLSIDSNTQDASSMGLLSDRINFPSVKFDRYAFYSPAPTCVEADKITKILPAGPIDRMEYLKIINDSPDLSKAYPGGLVNFNNIVPNNFLKSVGMAEGYFGELIISNGVRNLIKDNFEFRFIERNEYCLIIPFSVMDVIKLDCHENIVDKIIKIGTNEVNEMIKGGAEANNQAFYILHDRMSIYIKDDVVKNLNGLKINKYFDFVHK